MQDRKKIADELYHAGDSLLAALEAQAAAMQNELTAQTDAAQKAVQENAKLAQALEETKNAAAQANGENARLQQRLTSVCSALRNVADKIEGRA